MRAETIGIKREGVEAFIRFDCARIGEETKAFKAPRAVAMVGRDSGGRKGTAEAGLGCQQEGGREAGGLVREDGPNRPTRAGGKEREKMGHGPKGKEIGSKKGFRPKIDLDILN